MTTLFSGIGENIGLCKRDVPLAVGLFVLAVVPRVLQLDVFLTPDEPVWIEGTVRFFQALLSRDYANAYHLASPGITTMWVAGLGLIAKYLTRSWASLGGEATSLWSFLQSVPLHPVDVSFLCALRLPVALITSCTVVGAYFFVKELFDRKVAVLSAIMIALDPFYMAHSRLIVLDALVTSFMLLSILGFIIYLKDQRSLGRIVFSGIAAGLAFLTKSPSLFLAPFMLFLVLATNLLPINGSMRTVPRRAYRDFLVLGIWALTALLIYFLLWPAMWVDPIGMVSRTMDKAVTHARVSELKGNFFWGGNELDPSPLFYPVHLLFRITPLALLGIAASLALLAGLIGKKEKKLDILLLLAYVLLYMTFMTMGSTKAERYLLPVFPVVDILAAVGLGGLAREVWQMSGHVSRHASLKNSSRLMFGPLVALLLQAAFSLPFHPYYFTYYNPLTGGGPQAVRALMVGWGEGLDEAARYLNRKENAKELKIATWYNYVVNPFTLGQAINLDPWFSADYVVFYINQIQRGLPEAKILDYFRPMQPEHIVRLQGIDYAWIYRVPERVPPQVLPLERLEPISFGDSVLLLGYNLDNKRVQSGDSIPLTFYWQCLKPMEESYHIYLRLLDSVDHVWGEQSAPPLSPWGELPTSQWKAGAMYRDDQSIAFLPDTPPGVYRVGLSLYDPQRRLELESTEGSKVVLGLVEVKGTQFGDQIFLFDYAIIENREPFDGNLRIRLYWRALREMGEDYIVYLKLINDAYHIWGQQDGRPYWDGLPTNSWKKGQVVEDSREIPVLPGTPPGSYQVEIILYDLHSGQTLEPTGGEKPLLGPVEIPRWKSLSVEVLDIEHPMKVNLGGKVSLLGYNIESGFQPGDNLHLTLFWQALSKMDRDYTVFTHLVDGEGRIWGQKDDPPVDGFYPTTKWQAGEIVRDQYDLPIAPDAPVGDYKIKVGMYLAETGERLSVNVDDTIQLTEVTVAW